MADSAKVIIVGQGLAGSILAQKFLNHHWEVKCIYHHEMLPAASRVAGGLFNPITGRKLHLTWNAETLFRELHSFYPEMERQLEKRFFHPFPIYRIFDSIASQNDGLSRASMPEMSEFTSTESYRASGTFTHFKDDFGSIEVQKGGFLDTTTFLTGMNHHFQEKGILESGCQLTFKDLSDSKDIIIWCTGTGLSGIAAFDGLPFKPVKGEVLTVQIPDLEVNGIVIGGGIFLIPLGKHLFRLGATYNWDLSHTEPTLEALEHLTGTLQSLLKKPLPIKVVDHKVGIRPAVKDRKPLIGRFKSHPNHWIFNGFGSKGVSLIPALAENLVQHLSGKSELPMEVSIERYQSLM